MDVYNILYCIKHISNYHENGNTETRIIVSFGGWIEASGRCIKCPEVFVPLQRTNGNFHYNLSNALSSNLSYKV